MPEWRAPKCPGCDFPPVLHFGGSQAFCGNEECAVFSWERDQDPLQQMLNVQKIRVEPREKDDG